MFHHFRHVFYLPVVVGEYRPVAVSEVETPQFDVLVGGGAGEERAVVGDVDGEDGQLVAVEGEEELKWTG